MQPHSVGSQRGGGLGHRLDPDVQAHLPIDDRLRRRPRGLVHDVGIAALHAQRQRRSAIGDQVEPQQLNGGQRRGQPGQHGDEDDRDLRQVARNQVEDELADIGIDDAALLHRSHDAGEIVVGQHHVGGLFDHIRPGDAHADADVRPLERRRIVHPVAGHGDHLPVRLQSFDDARFVLRRHPGIDVVMHHGRCQGSVVERIQIGAGDHPMPGADQSDLLGDRPRRRREVTGDHHRAQAGALGQLNGSRHLGPRRIDHPEQTDEDQITLDRLGVHLGHRLILHPVGHCQHAQSVLRHAIVGLKHALAVGFLQGGHPIV